MKYFLIIFFLSILICICSCSRDKLFPQAVTVDYLHLSHTRTNSDPGIDSLVEGLDFSKYNMLWLGGDLEHATSYDPAYLAYADSIFDLGNPNTLWSLGNHDYDNLQSVQSVTGRAPYYAYYKNGITFIVLDTQDSLSNIIGDQKIFFESVVDTVQQSSHLIILTHQLIWMYGDSILEPQINAVTNGGFGNCFYCINPNNFYIDLYPKLLTVKQRGIEVICIGGDIGFNTKEFTYEGNEGIVFLASGINFGSADNKALLFHHDILNRRLAWEYVLLSNL